MSKINDINKKTSLGKIYIKKDGNITEKGIYRNDKLDGLFLQWTTSHTTQRPLLISSEHYKDGKLHGPRVLFEHIKVEGEEGEFLKQHVKHVSNFIDGKLDGENVELDNQRKIVTHHSYYKNGKLHGPYYDVWGPDDPECWRTYTNYKNGKLEGKKYIFYGLDTIYPNEIIEYKNNCCDGVRTEHNNVRHNTYPETTDNDFHHFEKFKGIETYSFCSKYDTFKKGKRNGYFYNYSYNSYSLSSVGETLSGYYHVDKNNPIGFKGPRWKYDWDTFFTSNSDYEDSYFPTISCYEYYDEKGNLLFYDNYEYHSNKQLQTSTRHSRPKNFDEKKWVFKRYTYNDFRLPIDPFHSKVRTYYYENGNIEREVSYKFVDYSEQKFTSEHHSPWGYEVGPFTLYYENGDIKEQGTRRDIKNKPYNRDEHFEGEYVSYYENGNIERKGKYNKDGKRIGTWIKESQYEERNYRTEKDYKNGLEMVIRNYKDDKLNTTYKNKYDKNGILLEQCWNQNNEIHCSKWIHDKNGKVIEYQEYVDGKLKESRKV